MQLKVFKMTHVSVLESLFLGMKLPRNCFLMQPSTKPGNPRRTRNSQTISRTMLFASLRAESCRHGHNSAQEPIRQPWINQLRTKTGREKDLGQKTPQISPLPRRAQATSHEMFLATLWVSCWVTASRFPSSPQPSPVVGRKLRYLLKRKHL